MNVVVPQLGVVVEEGERPADLEDAPGEVVLPFGSPGPQTAPDAPGAGPRARSPTTRSCPSPRCARRSARTGVARSLIF